MQAKKRAAPATLAMVGLHFPRRELFFLFFFSLLFSSFELMLLLLVSLSLLLSGAIVERENKGNGIRYLQRPAG